MIEPRSLKRLREKFEITRKQIADLTGIGEATVFRFEKGESKPHFVVERKLMMITKFLEKKENDSEN